MAFAVQIAKGIFDLVRDDLALVGQEIAAQNDAAIEAVAEIASYLREGGGKRLRPAGRRSGQAAEGYGRGARGIRTQRGPRLSVGRRFARFHGVARATREARAE